MSKVSLPLSIIIQFYYYYSTFTLIICWGISPILFYIILSQSKKLSSIKWLILNQSIWCLALQTLLGLVKPLFLSPAAGGIQLGIFRDIGNFKNSAAAAFICLALSGNCVCGLFAIITSRYLYVFPSKITKYLTFKIAFLVMAVLTVLSYVLLIITFYSLFTVDILTIHKWAIEYDPFLQNFFDDSSFFYIPHFLHDRVIPGVLSLLGFIIISLILLSIFFVSQISKNQTISTTKFQKSLVVSSIMQIYLTNIFLIVPIFLFFLFIAFDIPYSASVMCILVSVIMTHCLVEFIATLYCILPYRKFIISCFKTSGSTRNVIVQDVSVAR